MAEPEWVNTAPGDVLGPHDGLRVTFVESSTWWAPTSVEAADLRDNLAHLIRTLESGGHSIVPAEGYVIPPPGATAWTIDFKTPSGNVAVVTALNELQGALYGPLDLLRRTFIRRVEKFSYQTWGEPIPYEELDYPEPEECDLACMVRRGAIAAGLVAGVALLLVYAPEIKTVTRAFTTKRKAA